MISAVCITKVVSESLRVQSTSSGKREAMGHCSFIGKFKLLSLVHQGC